MESEFFLGLEELSLLIKYNQKYIFLTLIYAFNDN